MIDWLASDAWQSPDAWETADYGELIIQTFQEAIEPGQPLYVHPPMLERSPLTQHQVVSVGFGRGPDLRWETWTGYFVVGPLGGARLSQNPAALAQALAHDRVDFTASELLWPTSTHALCDLLAVAIGPSRGPDYQGRADRFHYTRGGVFSPYDVRAVEERSTWYRIVPDDPAAWAAIAARIRETDCALTPDAFTAQFSLMMGIGGRRAEFTSYDVSIARDTYAITWTREVLGALACDARDYPRLGRPLLIAATAHHAGLASRTDWCT